MSIWVLRGTIPGGGLSAVANFLGRQIIGITQTVVGDFGRFPLATGVSVSESPKRLTTPQEVGVALAQLISGVVNYPVQTLGVVLTQKNSGTSVAPVGVAAEIIQWVTNLVQTTYAIANTSGGTWTNPANGHGANNGVFATNANTLTQAASGSVVYSFASQFNKNELTISSVQLSLFCRYVAGLLGPGTRVAEYSLDGGSNYTTIYTGNTAFDASTTPQTIDLTTLVGQDWSKLTNLRVRFTHTANASSTPSTFSVDAVRVVVNASRTDSL